MFRNAAMEEPAVKLKPCPCGVVPSRLHITGQDREKWQRVGGDCCGAWDIEFRTNYLPEGSDELMALATEAWNDAPRSILTKPEKY
jgi:hypothetical protein